MSAAISILLFACVMNYIAIGIAFREIRALRKALEKKQDKE